MSGELDTELLALAARQHSVVARRQLLALGLSRDQVDWRLRRGWLRLVHRGVYAVARANLRSGGLCCASPTAT